MPRGDAGEGGLGRVRTADDGRPRERSRRHCHDIGLIDWTAVSRGASRGASRGVGELAKLYLFRACVRFSTARAVCLGCG